MPICNLNSFYCIPFFSILAMTTFLRIHPAYTFPLAPFLHLGTLILQKLNFASQSANLALLNTTEFLPGKPKCSRICTYFQYFKMLYQQKIHQVQGRSGQFRRFMVLWQIKIHFSPGSCRFPISNKSFWNSFTSFYSDALSLLKPLPLLTHSLCNLQYITGLCSQAPS
jgi:hypothetical protein